MARKQEGKRSATPQSRRALWSRGKWWFIGGGVAAAIVLLFLLSTSLSGSKTSKAGIPAPDITLATLDGEIRLSDLRGQPLLLYFSFPG